MANANELLRLFGLYNVRVVNISNKYNKEAVQKGYLEPDPTLYKSLLGTPVLTDLTLSGGTYFDTVLKKDVDFPSIVLGTVIMTVDFAARIIKTEIQGRDGTVKEYIGQDDAKISIQGRVDGWNKHFPIEEVSKLKQWIKAPVAKGVVNEYLKVLGIDSVVVESASFPQEEGGYSYQLFSIECCSDFPVELKITTGV